MYPSAPGSLGTGTNNSMNSQNAQNVVMQPRGLQSRSVPLGQGDRSSPTNPPPVLDKTLPTNNWFYPPPSDASRNSVQRVPPALPSMIGPTSAFYNPTDASHRQNDGHTQYQQWIDAYGSQQQQHQPQLRNQYESSQQVYSRISTQPHQTQTEYGFAQGRYTPPSSLGGYAESTSETVTQANVGSSITSNGSYPQEQQTSNFYQTYFSELLSANSSGATTPDRHQPYFSIATEPGSHTFAPVNDPYHHSQARGHQQPFPQHQGLVLPRQSDTLQVQRSVMPYPTARLVPPPRANPQPSISPPATSLPESTYPSHSNQSGTNSSRGNSSNSPAAGSLTAAGALSIKPGVSDSSLQKQPVIPDTKRDDSPNYLNPSPPSGKVSAKRKRARKNESPQWPGTYGADGGSESDSDDDDYGGGISVGMGGLGVISGGKRERRSRLPGACTHCKKLKMKCDFPRNDNTCKRCKAGGHVCIVEGRKPRTAPNKREYLLAQIRQKDAIIESLLKQLHNPYIATPMSIASYRMATSPSDQNNRDVLAWLDRLQSSVRDAGKKAGPRAFLDTRNPRNGEEEDSDVESDHRTHAQIYGLVAPDDDETAGNCDLSTEDAENLQSSLPDSHVPLGLIANLSLCNSKAKGRKDNKEGLTEEDLNDDNVGVANDTYFLPGPATNLDIRATLIEQHSPPEILVHGLVTPQDVEKLFQIFYERVNPFISLLDPALHTPASTFARCPFLFTVICAISSRYYTEKSEIYPIAMHFAKHSAANALIDGWKSVELCQAYILMSIYAVPARRWEEDRSWLYAGLAIRIATDLNLHQVSSTKPQTEKQEREILNRTRVWMICFNLDRSTATQLGKPSTIKEDLDDSIVRNAKDWYKKSQYNHNYDVHLCAYAALLQIVAKFHDEIFSDPSTPSGLNKQVDFRRVTIAHDAHLTAFHEDWAKRFAEDSDPNDSSCAFRCLLLPFLVGYSRLVMFSFGFQQAFQRGIEPGDHVFFTKCLEAAKSVIKNMIDGLAPSGYMRYAPDGHFVFASFASAFLLKLLRPEFSTLLAKDQENDIFDLIGRLIQTLSSPKISIDDRHTPKLYARFLAGLLSRHRRDGATAGRLHPYPPPQNAIPTHTGDPPASSMNTFSITPPQNQNLSGQDSGYNQTTFQATEKMNTPIYMPEATFAASTGAIHFGSDLEIATYTGNGVSDEEMLATMHAIKNPAWWQNMMMPGFSWPEGSPSPPAMPPPPYHQNINFPGNVNTNIPGIHPGFPMFQGAPIPMH